LPSSISVGTTSILISRTLFTALEPQDEILYVLNDEFVTSHSDGNHHFFIRWNHHPSTDDAWITEEEC